MGKGFETVDLSDTNATPDDLTEATDAELDDAAAELVVSVTAGGKTKTIANFIEYLRSKGVGDIYVDDLPDAADAVLDRTYIRRGDKTSWTREDTTVVTPASITHAPFTGYFADYTDRGIHAAEGDVTSPAQDDIYFDTARNSFRLYNGTVWNDRTVAQVTNTSHVGVGIGAGTPIPITIDTEEEVAAYFANNGFDSANTYLINLTGQSNIREATSYTASSSTTTSDLVPLNRPTSFHYQGRRTIVLDADRDETDEMVIDVDIGDIYTVKVDEHSGTQKLPRISDITVGTQIAVSEGSIYWEGRVHSYEAPSGTLHTICVEFYERHGTFTTGREVTIEFGAIGRNHRSYYFTEGLTLRRVSSLEDTQIVNTEGVVSFNATAQQSKYGGVEDIDFEDIQDVTGADARTDSNDVVVDASNGVITFPAGDYHIRAKLYGTQGADENAYVGLFRVINGSADRIETFAGQSRQFDYFGTGEGQPDSIYEIDEPDFEVIGEQQYYLQLRNFDASANRLAGYLRIERVT